MSELLGKPVPTRERRSSEERFADAQATQQYFKDGEKEKPIKYILEEGEWKPVIPGDRDYKRALPDRYDRLTGMPISPWDPAYEDASKKRPKQFR